MSCTSGFRAADGSHSMRNVYIINVQVVDLINFPAPSATPSTEPLQFNGCFRLIFTSIFMPLV